MESDSLKKTALYDVHAKMGAKIVEFAGFYMPVVYSSIIEEHLCVRSTVGVFDVSHMGEFRITGEKALDLIQKVTLNDASKLEVGQVQYSAMCYPDGGIIDDLLVYRFGDHYMIVVNASNTDKDFAWIEEHMIDGVDFKNMTDEITLIAVQGPQSMELLQKLTSFNLSSLKFYRAAEGTLADSPTIISRTGYTGELGFELYMTIEHSEHVWNSIFEKGRQYNIKPIGLGARDTLRLEKKMCLYGNDITKDTNPIEAGLGWITKLDKGDFIGSSAIAKIKERGPDRKLVGFEIIGKGIPRHGYEIAKDGAVIGEVTSGTFSPSLSKGIGLGYVATEHAKIGTELSIITRGKEVPAVIIKPPFV